MNHLFSEGREGVISISNCSVLVVSGRGVLNIGNLGQGSQAQKHTGLWHFREISDFSEKPRNSGKKT